MFCQLYGLPSFPVPAVGCNQSTFFVTLTAIPVAPHPPELEAQDAEALELSWSFPGAECYGEV